MAETTPAPNNKPVTFPQKVTREVSRAATRDLSGAAKKSSVRKKAQGAINRGMISEKAAKRHLAGV